jgi:hypothetical protein
MKWWGKNRAHLMLLWEQSRKIPQYYATLWIHDCQRLWKSPELWVGKPHPFGIFFSPNALWIILLDIPRNVD